MHRHQPRTRGTRSAQNTPAERSGDQHAHLERLLDEALAATFPASDPVSSLVHEELSREPKPGKKRRAGLN
jgi:hypothetical protein